MAKSAKSIRGLGVSKVYDLPIYLGVDPGNSGGLALIYGVRPEEVDLQPLAKLTERDIWEVISGYPAGNIHAVIEKVQGHIGNPHPGSAMFKFGHSYGGLRMALVASAIPFEEVTPTVWQRALGITPRLKGRTVKTVLKQQASVTGCCARHADNQACDCLEQAKAKKSGETRKQFKRRLRAKAQQLFPRLQVTLEVADALLLAEYCRRLHQGLLPRRN